MNIGVLYNSWYECSSILYVLGNGIFQQEEEQYTFTIVINGDKFYFARDLQQLKNFNVEFNLVLLLITDLTNYHKNINQLISIKNYKLIQIQNQEKFHISNEVIIDFLNNGHLILSGARTTFEHPNLVHDLFFNLYFFYYDFGYQYLNFYKKEGTKTLLGIYHRNIHVDGISRNWRECIYNEVLKILPFDTINYTKLSNSQFDKILENNDGFGFWSKTVKISSYTDYSTSICNIMFESQLSSNDEPYLSEKTLQSIIFSQENIFFLWNGPELAYKKLKEMGFWFLNFEFYNEDEEPLKTEIATLYPTDLSILHTARYLKELKHALSDNLEIYKYLMIKYGKNLEKNKEIFFKLLKVSPYQKEILEKIKE